MVIFASGSPFIGAAPTGTVETASEPGGSGACWAARFSARIGVPTAPPECICSPTKYPIAPLTHAATATFHAFFTFPSPRTLKNSKSSLGIPLYPDPVDDLCRPGQERLRQSHGRRLVRTEGGEAQHGAGSVHFQELDAGRRSGVVQPRLRRGHPEQRLHRRARVSLGRNH